MKKMKGTSDSHPAFDLRHPDIVCPEQIVPGSVQELGFLYGGPAALGFLNWITEQAQRDRIDHILFLSPDGYIPERFARLCSGSNNSRLPPFHYFYGSSIFFILTAIFEYNFTEFLPLLLSDSKGLSPGELLERIGVPKPSEKVMNDLIVHDDSINTDVQDEFLTKFFYAFRSEILKICRKNRRALFFYLKSLGNQPGNRVAIVDIGWNGVNQNAFELALINIMGISVF